MIYIRIFLSVFVLSAVIIKETHSQGKDVSCYVCNSFLGDKCKSGEVKPDQIISCKEYFKKVYGSDRGYEPGETGGDAGWGGKFPGTVKIAEAGNDGFVQNFINERKFVVKNEERGITDIPTACRKIVFTLSKGADDKTHVIRTCAWGGKDTIDNVPRKYDKGVKYGTDILGYMCLNNKDTPDKPCNNGGVLKSMIFMVLSGIVISLFFN